MKRNKLRKYVISLCFFPWSTKNIIRDFELKHKKEIHILKEFTLPIAMGIYRCSASVISTTPVISAHKRAAYMYFATHFYYIKK